MAEFRLTPAALRDLEGIWRYTAQQWGVAQAERYLDALNASFEDLAHAPLSAPACDDIRPGYRRHGVERHAVYYRVEAVTVIVVRVLHERMDAPRHL
ncbi:plasmid stabilization system [Acidithiobacillus ferrivorans SS3]|uniref:Toxin n=1 Tax=Acidithiobacillus ferrivorans SS3 TaxID=743299 RepID=G0JMJ1_9PROT|nr:type II toxin-antitoxin system RelE/ParE family toxin [Acidithiobacillus ferrivorans]AEM47020.1 plasmid stabilization system [Acidithiobacillus ferrivorans SS3]MBU2851946.1 type II toxin-antitoxin system RelE/ParE family toxin [Acidithiobacillus ferrivorans]OFA15835.1 plasmid stabilization protein ParE [Acidithiobacillus ferrivorans]